MRRAAMERDGYRCRKCGRAGRMEVDHIKRTADGGDMWDLDNLQSLCRECHIEKSRSERIRPLTPSEWAWHELVDELTSSPSSQR